MTTHKNHAKATVGAIAMLLLFAVSILAFADELGIGREAARTFVQPVPAPLAGPAADQTVLFIGFDGIQGESTDKDHAGWSVALSFTQALTVPDTSGPASAGRAIVKDFVVTKVLDKASPKLAQYASQGTHLKAARIHVTRSTGAGNKTFYAYDLMDVLVTSYRLTDTTGSFPVEELSLSFNEIRATYTEFDSAGAPKGTTTYSYRRT
ncbi:MAG: type VI secretion system tube protein Hcp [Phycisphaerales bacterium]|jgi:type VI secretion system Hcp family effector